MKKLYFAVAIIILSVLLLICSCSSTTTIFQQAPNTSSYIQTTVVPTSRYTPPPPSTPVTQTWTWQPTPGNTLGGGTYAYFPATGAFVQAGHTLTLTWSSDGSLDAFILTQNQYNNFKNNFAGYVSGSMASGSGTNGNLQATIQNSDTYYAIIRNTFTLGSPIKLYWGTLTAR